MAQIGDTKLTTEHEPCNPAEYIKWGEIKEHCEDHHDSMYKWASTNIKASEADRKDTKDRVIKLEGFKDKLLWVIILASVGIIGTNILGPMISKSSDTNQLSNIVQKIEDSVKEVRELKGYFSIMSSEQSEQKKIINDIKRDQERRKAKEIK